MPLTLTRPDSPATAFELARERELFPSTLGSREQREELAVELRSKAVFSARVSSETFLFAIRKVVNSIVGDERDPGDARVSGMSVAEGRVVLRNVLDALGYTPEGGFPGDEGQVPPAVEGTLQDLRSRRRLDLILRTQIQLVQGRAQRDQGRGRVSLLFFPAWELVRFDQAEVPRDWATRFEEAGGTLLIDEDGRRRLAAHKNDPVWDALGDSALFDDALDVDHPPFAFNSGMGWFSLGAAEFESLGGQLGAASESRDESLLPGNVATLENEEAQRRVLEGFSGVQREGRRVSARSVRDAERARLLERFALEEAELEEGGGR